jgi:hypothetical protein
LDVGPSKRVVGSGSHQNWYLDGGIVSRLIHDIEGSKILADPTVGHPADPQRPVRPIPPALNVIADRIVA